VRGGEQEDNFNRGGQTATTVYFKGGKCNRYKRATTGVLKQKKRVEKERIEGHY
jgi:hypothetical protein